MADFTAAFFLITPNANIPQSVNGGCAAGPYNEILLINKKE